MSCTEESGSLFKNLIESSVNNAWRVFLGVLNSTEELWLIPSLRNLFIVLSAGLKCDLLGMFPLLS